ncbi:DoxX family protein [Achromobacter xylosoxidans]|uniref:DoxX family protein n=1 Tax=Alcaligenes xylosoxydans xylosoxydans TaxID=85698 RepID=UPI001232E974|nr:DoxX family protein [Achromobacter xylosoxidans]KAA5921765.1 DoxX family protein [Achromobacter xylosoxidans]
MNNEALLVARLFLGVPFIVWGVLKLRGGEAKLEPVLTGMGLPDAKLLAYLVGLCELIGGIGVTLGYPVRTVGVLLGLWSLIAGYAAHRNDISLLLTHVAMAGGFFLLAVVGAGSIALFGGVPTGLFAYLP